MPRCDLPRAHPEGLMAPAPPAGLGTTRQPLPQSSRPSLLLPSSAQHSPPPIPASPPKQSWPLPSLHSEHNGTSLWALAQGPPFLSLRKRPFPVPPCLITLCHWSQADSAPEGQACAGPGTPALLSTGCAQGSLLFTASPRHPILKHCPQPQTLSIHVHFWAEVHRFFLSLAFKASQHSILTGNVNM